MEKLNIFGAKLGDDVFTVIASCVTNIDKLWISYQYGTEVTIKGSGALAQRISKRNKPVSYQQGVYFSYNEMFSSVS